jgi:lipopolysaccharide heptosyltransferase II
VKILILKPSSLGDVIQALPVLRLLKLHWPSAKIFWWLESSLIPLLEGDPDLAGIVSFPRQQWGSVAGAAAFWRSVQALRRERLDLAIDLQGLARSALMSWLVNPQLTVGLDNPREGQREGARAAYDVLAPGSAPSAHSVERYRAVLKTLGVPADRPFEWLPARVGAVEQFNAKWQLGDATWIGLVPGARWETKRWPGEHFAEVVQRLTREDSGVRFAILGGAADRELASVIGAAAPDRCLDLTGRTSLAEMVEWIRATRLVITNDTGPMHVAAALGKPVVALFGATDPTSTGPYGQLGNVLQNRAVPCVPCLRRTCSYIEPLACLKTITPAAVCRMVERLMVGTMGTGEGGRVRVP